MTDQHKGEVDLHAPLRPRQNDIVEDAHSGSFTLSRLARKYRAATHTMGCFLDEIDETVNYNYARKAFLDAKKRGTTTLEGRVNIDLAGSDASAGVSLDDLLKAIDHSFEPTYFETSLTDAFNNLATYDDDSIKYLLTEVDNDDLGIALAGANEKTRVKIYSNYIIN